MNPSTARRLASGAAASLALVLLVAACSDRSVQSDLVGGGTNAAMLIEPNIAIGPIRAGMTVQQVVAALGEPQRRTSNALEYNRLGLAVMPGPDGVVQVVMCGDVTGLSGPFVKAFTGRTKEQIGMLSTRAQLLQAYGEPTADEKMRGGSESMKYDLLGITFTLESGKVHHMIMRLRGPLEPDRTIMVEPVPQPAR